MIEKNNSNPIGIFDSGIGGLNIWKQISNLLPLESTVYFADRANTPYGNLSNKEIINLSIKNTEFLLKKNCKIIVVACNTATTIAIESLRNKFKNIEFIGIEPAIKVATEVSKTKNILLLATKGTINSIWVKDVINSYSENYSIITKIGTGLANNIENGKINECQEFIKKTIEYISQNSIDTLVLGCTHYGFLIPLLESKLDKKVKIIEPSKAIANQTKVILSRHKISNKNKKVTHDLFTNKPEGLVELVINLKDLDYHFDISIHRTKCAF